MANNTYNTIKWEDKVNNLDHKNGNLVANITQIHADLAGIKGSVDALKALNDSMEKLLHKQTHEHIDELPYEETSQHGENRPPYSL